MAIEHRHKALGCISRIAGFDDDIEDQSAFAGRQVELVPVLNLTPSLDDDVSVRLEQADQLLAGRHDLAVKHATSGLDNNTRDQRQVMRDLGTPAFGSDLGRLGQPSGHHLQFISAGLGSSDQLAIELALFVLPAAVLDGAGPLLGQAPPIAPSDRRRPRQRLAALQQPGHDPYRI